jgi:integrase
LQVQILSIDKKISIITKDQKPFIIKILTEMANTNPTNGEIVCNYIVAEQDEINIAPDTKADKIKRLEHLSRHYFHMISFKNMTKENIQHYLNKLKKSEEIDPLHKWIGTYNSRYNIFLKFFKWVYFSNKQAKERKTPPCMKGIKPLTRNETSRYTADDMWKDHEAAIFLKYCNDPRDRCYMAMAYESSGRPHELLKLKFEDAKIEVDSDNQKYARVILRSNKRGVKPRTVGFTFAIPYYKEWRNKNSFGTNEKAYIFVSLAKKNKMQRITRDGLYKRFNEYYRQNYFPKLLNDETIPSEDKQVIKKMFKKPWNLYVQRHSSLTHIAKTYSPGDENMRAHAGWTTNSKNPEKYMHYFGDETANMFLEKKGIKTNGNKGDPLKSIQCPNCSEANKPTNTFCDNCKLVLKMDAFYTKPLKEHKLENRLLKLQFTQWKEDYKKEKVLQIKNKLQEEASARNKLEPTKIYHIIDDQKAEISAAELINNFKIFYKENIEEDLTDEEITSLNVQPAVIKVGRLTWSPGKVISPKQFMEDLGLSYEEVNDFFANILASRNKSA